MYRYIYRNAFISAVGFSCALAWHAYAPRALAQAAEQPAQQSPQPQAPQQRPAQQPADAQADSPDIDEGGEKRLGEGDGVVVQPQMQPDERPTPPQSESLQELRQGEQPPIITGAGVGSDVAYASQGVVEVGGSLAITHASDTTTFRVAPSVGYFIVDNLELSFFPELLMIHVDGEGDEDGNTDVTIGGALEPSYHLPLSDRIFAFGGLGLGVRYADDPGVDVFLRPRLGMDFMVGRSGIFKPAVFVDIGANDGLTSGGFEAGFTVML